MRIIPSRKFDNLPNSTDYTLSVLEEKIRKLQDDIEYALGRFKKAKEEASIYENTILELTAQKEELEASLEKLK